MDVRLASVSFLLLFNEEALGWDLLITGNIRRFLHLNLIYTLNSICIIFVCASFFDRFSLLYFDIISGAKPTIFLPH